MDEREAIAEGLERHREAVLMCSGGRDSTALLELCRPFWKDIVVMWVNSGAAHPETIRQMNVVRRAVPNFAEIHSNVQAHITANGYPVDVLPLRFTPVGRAAEPTVSTKLQAYSDCCRVNLWQPAWDAVKELGITMVLRGERAIERQKGPARNGHIEEGIELFQPIYDWSDAEVMLFLAEHQGFVSESYDHHGKGLDCWCCTAFWHDAPGHLAYLQRREPHLYDELTHRLREVRHAVDGEVAVLHNLLGG